MPWPTPRKETLEENIAYEGDVPEPWSGSAYDTCREVYPKLVDFQIQVQQKMIGHLSDKVAAAQQS